MTATPSIPPGRGGPQKIPRPDGWRLGGPPPWVDADIDVATHFDVGVLSARLAQRTPVQFNQPWRFAPGGHVSAVLAALYLDGDGGPGMVLTKRAASMRSHSGELSFPGGRRDDSDVDLRATALREAFEEIALDPADVEIIGELDRFVTGGSHSLVHPHVGLLPTFPDDLMANPAEVDEILRVSIAELIEPDAWREEHWVRPGGTAVVTFFELHGHTLWGATAQMVRQLITIWLGVADPRLGA